MATASLAVGAGDANASDGGEENQARGCFGAFTPSISNPPTMM